MIDGLMGTMPGNIHIAIQPSETYSREGLKPFLEQMFEGHHMKGAYTMQERREARKFVDTKVEQFLNKIIKKPENEKELVIMTQAPIEEAVRIQDNFLSAAGIFVIFVTVDVLGRPVIVPGDEISKVLKYKEERERKKQESIHGKAQQ
jgi:hypothetical protein